jgi:hypothetical protein
MRLVEIAEVAQDKPEIGPRGGMLEICGQHRPVVFRSIGQLALIALQVGEVEKDIRCSRPQRQSTAIARLGFFESPARSQRNAEIGMGQGEIRDISEQPLVKNDRLIDLAGMVMPHRFGKEPTRGFVGLTGHCGKSAQAPRSPPRST